MSVMMGFNGASGGPNMGGGGDLIFPHAPSDLSPHGLGPHPGGGGGGGGGGVGSGVVDDSQLERRGLDTTFGLDSSGGLGGMHGPRGGIGDGGGGGLCPQLDSPYPPSPHNLSSDMNPALDPSESATSINNNLLHSNNNNTVGQRHLASYDQSHQELRDAITGAGIGGGSPAVSSKPRRRRRTPPLAHIDLQDTSLYSVYCFVKSFLSASNASTVAIDNKIEQAMDLVKSHLMFAVREEVEVLKEKIGELMDRISQLEYENTVLRQCATQDALQQISQQHPSSNT